MSDRQLRIGISGGLSMLVSFLLWGAGATDIIEILLFSSLPFVLGFSFPWLMNLLSSACSILYLPHQSTSSYENNFLQDDMEKAKRLALDGSLDEAMTACREIALKAPNRCEVRFQLAETYRLAGQPGLAMGEYQRIVRLWDEAGSNCVYVRESQRAIEELKKELTGSRERSN